MRYAASFFAVARVGAVVAPLDPAYRAQELEYYLRDLQPAAVLADGESLAAVAALPGLGPRGPSRAPGARGRRRAPRAAVHLRLHGRPKRVVRGHGALLRELATLARTF
jgi:acyl-CoA synthetase (AMP-forming)/AMP-acid ligase II